MERRVACCQLPMDVFKRRLEIPPAVEIIGVRRRENGQRVDVYLSGDMLPRRFVIAGSEMPLNVPVASVSDLAEALVE